MVTSFKEITDNYPKFYDDVMNSIVSSFEGSEKLNLAQKLKSKRDAGLKKYGDKSFQNSFNNSLTVDTNAHCLEELLDAINYMIHEEFKSSLTYPKGTSRIRSIIKKLINCYDDVLSLKLMVDKLMEKK
jgi:hypothetical protein